MLRVWPGNWSDSSGSLCLHTSSSCATKVWTHCTIVVVETIITTPTARHSCMPIGFARLKQTSSFWLQVFSSCYLHGCRSSSFWRRLWMEKETVGALKNKFKEKWVLIYFTSRYYMSLAVLFISKHQWRSFDSRSKTVNAFSAYQCFSSATIIMALCVISLNL